MKISTICITLFVCLTACASQKASTTQNDLNGLFDDGNQVMLLSYKSQSYREPIREEDITNPPAMNPDTVHLLFGSLKILKSSVKDSIVLTNHQRTNVLGLLKTNMCNVNGLPICFDPHHALVFFNSNATCIGYIEFCFACTNYDASGGVRLNYCYEKSEELKKLFRDLGVTYFGSGEN